jgi:hypothetical protein
MAPDESRGAPPTREAIRSVIERLHRLWSTGDLSLIPELYAADFVAHFPAGWEFKGHLDVREVVESARIAFPDWTETVADIIIELVRSAGGLTQVKMLPQLAVFDHSEPTILAFMQDGLLQQLSPEEATEWRTGRKQAESEGTFFMTWPHHCAVGVKPA